MHRSEKAKIIRELEELPAPRLGIIGGGQLAKMTANAAAQFGCEVFVLERKDEFPAHSVDTHALIGDWNDPTWVKKLAESVDVVTLENEFVETRALKAVQSQETRLWPHVETMEWVQDKLSQKNFFKSKGLPVTPFKKVGHVKDIQTLGMEFNWPMVLKRRRNGYDGKGNFTVHGPEQIDEAWSKLKGRAGQLYVEAFCPFERELAVIVTRGQRGDLVSYPVVETMNREHICHVVCAPARIGSELASRAQEIAKKAVELIDGVGSFGVELFETKDGELLINEIAPRVHNTGHYTIEACHTSQFENHVRAVLGWPLGSPEMSVPASAMVNLLGAGPGSGIPRGLKKAMTVPGAHIHIYGKMESRRGRKMGHVTAVANSLDTALQRAREAADCIQFGECDA